jgi:type I restriction enzyme S subunit
MNAERLLEHYHRIGDAPDAIARLRRFILDLAVRGKLVPQGSNDEPASELLKRIAKEKARLVKVGEIRKPKPLPKVDRPPFDIPRSWHWTRIREVTSDRGQTVPHKQFTYIDVTAIDKERGVVADPKVVAASEAPSRARKITTKGDVIYSCVRPYLLNVAVIDVDFDPAPIASTAFAVLNGHGLVLPRYLWTVLRSPFMVGCVEEAQRGQAYPAINDSDFALLPFPLPPLAEQGRVIAKLDELMELCTRLEAARAAREATRDRLTAASLARLNAPDPETLAGDARFTLDALPALTARPDQIKQLRQTVLNLAVRGKLVAQDPNDEPASELLKEIAKTRRKLYTEKKIPKPKALPAIEGAELPFPPPRGWAWSMLGDLCYQVSDGPRFSPQYTSPEHGVPFLSTRNIRPGGFDLDTVKYISRADHEEFCKRIRPQEGDIIYTKGGTTGIAKVNDLDFEFSVWVHLAVLRIEKERLYPRYVELALNSPHCYAQSQRYTQGTSNFDLGLTRMIKITLPLPPLVEQRRIVAKVDALVVLCDRLEASLDAAAGTRRRLLDALLAEALTPTIEREMEAAE